MGMSFPNPLNPPSQDTGSPVVPGQTPGTTPPFQGGQAQPTDQMTQRLLAALAQAAQRRQLNATPRPTPVPGQQSTEPPKYMQQMGSKKAGAMRFMYTLQGNIQNAVNKKKQGEVLRAEGVFDQISSASNELYAAQASGDQKAVASAQAKLDSIMSDPKVMKGVSQALNQDWLNPEKTNVWNQALKTSLQKQKQKEQAQTGIMGVFQKLRDKVQGAQVQLTDEQKQQMAREIQSKAPTTSTGGTVKDEVETAKGILDLEKASTEARQKYQFITAADGKVWAVNKNDPKDAFPLKDASTGQDVTGQTKTTTAPKVVSNAGVPYAVQRGGKTVTPESPDWTKDDQTLFDGALHAAKLKQDLRLDPIIADELGEPPDPKDYAQGKKDPAYGAALKKYGMDAEAVKTRMASAQAGARGMAYGEYRPVQVINPQTHDVEWMFAKDAISQGAAPGGLGATTMSKQAQIGDIETASQYMRKSINNLDRPFSADQIAKLTLAFQTPDEGIARNILQTMAGSQELTPAQQDFVIWAKQINERAMSLRSIAGMGAGSDQLRSAIVNTLPGVRSGSQQMALKQLDAFDQQVKVLKTGIPQVKGAGAGDATPQGQPVYKDGKLIGYTQDGKTMTPVKQ